MFGDKMNQVFSKPEVLRAMAGIGKGLDPEGAGGFLGKPAQALLTEQAKMRAQDEEKVNHEKLVQALRGLPPGSSVRQDAKGTIQIKSGDTSQKKSGLGGLEVPGVESYFSGLERYINDITADISSPTGQETGNTFKETLKRMKNFFDNL